MYQLQEKDRTTYIFMLGMLAAFAPITTDIYLPSLPEITSSLETNPSTVQLSLTTSFLGLAIGQVIIGPLSDAYGRRPMMLISLVLFVITSAICAMSIDIYMLIVARLFQGLAGSGGIVLSRAVACDMFRGSELTKFMAMLMTVNSLAPILGPMMGSGLMLFGSFRVIFWFLAIWGGLLFLLCYLKLDETCEKDTTGSPVKVAITNMAKELTNLRFMLMILSLSISMGGFFAYLAASPFVFQQIYGYSSFGYSVVFAANAIVITGLAQLAGRISGRTGDLIIVKVSVLIMIISSLAMLYLAFNPPESSVFVVIAILGFVGVVGSSQTAGFGVVMSTIRGAAGAATGLFGVTTFVAGAITSPLVGVMGEHSMVPLAICMVVCSGLAFLLFRIGIIGMDHKTL